MIVSRFVQTRTETTSQTESRSGNSDNTTDGEGKDGDHDADGDEVGWLPILCSYNWKVKKNEWDMIIKLW